MTKIIKDEFVYTGTDNLEAMLEAKNYNEYLISKVEKSATNKKIKILDFGAGSGTYAEMLRNRGYTVDCLEPDKKLQKVLKAKKFKVYSDINDLKSGSYDLIYALNVLEHIEEDGEIFKLLTKLLKKEGSIIVYVPAFQILYSAMDRLVEHHRRYRKTHLKKMAIDSNLSIVKLNYCDPIGFAATLAFKFIGNKSGSISSGSVKLYDRVAFPISIIIEPLTRRYIGKNVLLLARLKTNNK